MSPLDRLLSEPGDADLYPMLAGTSAPHRAEFRERLTDRERTVLGRYGFRSAITALREQSAARLRVGLIATALTLTDEDPRDIMVNMAVHYHVAQRGPGHRGGAAYLWTSNRCNPGSLRVVSDRHSRWP